MLITILTDWELFLQIVLQRRVGMDASKRNDPTKLSRHVPATLSKFGVAGSNGIWLQNCLCKDSCFDIARTRPSIFPSPKGNKI